MYRLVNFQTRVNSKRKKKKWSWMCIWLSSSNNSLSLTSFLSFFLSRSSSSERRRRKNNRRQLEQMARWFIWAENWVYYPLCHNTLMTRRFDRWVDHYPPKCQFPKRIQIWLTDFFRNHRSTRLMVITCMNVSVWNIHQSRWSLSLDCRWNNRDQMNSIQQ